MQYNMPAKDVKKMLPEVLNDLNYTIGLMDNMLAWAKSQMQGHQINKQEIDVTKIIEEVIHVLRLPAEAKQISVEHQTEGPVYVYADKEMIHLVLRNLISNAIKFTPQCGTITVGATETGQFAEVFVQDSGMGISPDALKKINSNSFYTTKGTSSESGTGLGLMLCKEFLHKNGGRMHIESEVGSGSLFSFTLPVH
jgi:two-component system, sensor histidine kinase and response regulator